MPSLSCCLAREDIGRAAEHEYPVFELHQPMLYLPKHRDDQLSCYRMPSSGMMSSPYHDVASYGGYVKSLGHARRTSVEQREDVDVKNLTPRFGPHTRPGLLQAKPHLIWSGSNRKRNPVVGLRSFQRACTVIKMRR